MTSLCWECRDRILKAKVDRHINRHVKLDTQSELIEEGYTKGVAVTGGGRGTPFLRVEVNIGVWIGGDFTLGIWTSVQLHSNSTQILQLSPGGMLCNVKIMHCIAVKSKLGLNFPFSQKLGKCKQNHRRSNQRED